MSSYSPLKTYKCRRYRPREYDSEDGPWDPFTGVASALLGTIGSLMMGVADLPIEFLRAVKITPNSQASHVNKGRQTNTNPNPNSASTRSYFAKSSTVSLTENTAYSSESIELPSTANMHSDNASVTEELESMEEMDSRQSTSPPRSFTPDHRTMLGKAIRRSSSRSRSPSGNARSLSPAYSERRPQPENEGSQMSLESALRTGKGVGRIVGVGLKTPMDFTMSLARGFHNAPKLYGDESVRHTDKVTGIQSGLKAAGKVRLLDMGPCHSAYKFRNLALVYTTAFPA